MPAYTLTLENAQRSGTLKSISNVCSSSQAFLDLLNEAQEGLAIRGGWFDLEQRIQFCLSSCHIVWPRFVGTVLGVRFCGGLATMQNQWYSFVNNNSGWNRQDAYGVGTGYGGGQMDYRTSPSQCVIEDAGTRPCYNEITGTTGKLIRYSVVLGNDVGKTITLFGRKYGAQPLQEQDASGNWLNGKTITAARPFATTTDLVTAINSVTREATQGMAYLYEYDAATDTLRDLAAYQPSETNPRYRASRICNMPGGRKDANGVCWTNIESLVKLKFIPVETERDFLLISNLRAVKFAIQAVQMERANDDSGATAKWFQAVNELNLELEDSQPKRAIPIRMNLGRQLCNPI